jgi:hypothetical protein
MKVENGSRVTWSGSPSWEIKREYGQCRLVTRLWANNMNRDDSTGAEVYVEPSDILSLNVAALKDETGNFLLPILGYFYKWLVEDTNRLELLSSILAQNPEYREALLKGVAKAKAAK